MNKPSLKLKSSPRRHRVTTAGIGAIQPNFNPYAQCECDLANLHGGIPSEWFVPLYHENGTTSNHLPKCLQLPTTRSKTSTKRKSSGMPASYLHLKKEDEEERKKYQAAKPKAVPDADARLKAIKDVEKTGRKRESSGRPASYLDPEEESKRKRFKVDNRNGIRDSHGRTDAIKTLKHWPYAQCCCDLLDDPDYKALCEKEGAVCEEEATICRTHPNGSTSFHAPSCLTDSSNTTPIRKPYASPPKSLRYADLEEKEQTREVRKRNEQIWRQPKEVKSAAYIDLEGEEEQGDGPLSPLAKRYDSRTIASDFLRAIGEHPYMPPLNAHWDGFPTKKHGRASK